MNYMSEVAKMLGVEIGEEFEIVFPNSSSSCYTTAKFTNEGVNVMNTNVYDKYNFKAYLLRDLLMGSYTIKRKPWRPEVGECYYFINESGLTVWDTWGSSYEDILLYKLGNCYKTRDGADKDAVKWLAFYASDEVLEV